MADESTTINSTAVLSLIQSLQSQLKNSSQGPDDEAGDDEATKTVCVLWDLAASQELAEFIESVGLALILAAIVSEHKTRPPRLVEVSLGALANLAAWDSVRQEMAQSSSVVRAPFLTLMSNSDSQCLREACRMLHAVTTGVTAATANPWREDLCDEPVLNQLLCFLINSLDESLLLQVCQLMHAAAFGSESVTRLLTRLHGGPIIAEVFIQQAGSEGELRDALLNLLYFPSWPPGFLTEVVERDEGNRFQWALQTMLVEAVAEGSEDISFVRIALEILGNVEELRSSQQQGDDEVALGAPVLCTAVRLLLVQDAEDEGDQEAVKLTKAAWRLLTAAKEAVSTWDVVVCLCANASTVLKAGQRHTTACEAVVRRVLLTEGGAPRDAGLLPQGGGLGVLAGYLVAL